MTVGQIALETVRNLRAHGVRSIIQVLLLAVATFATAASELAELNRLQLAADTRLTGGAYVFVASSGEVEERSAVDVGACLRLADSDAVVASGAVTHLGSTNLRSVPGAEVRRFAATAGVIEIWSQEPVNVSSSGRDTVWIGESLSNEYGVRRGDWLSIDESNVRVAGIVPAGPRSEVVSRSIVEVGVGSGRADECWVEFIPAVAEGAAPGIPAAVTTADSTSGLESRPLVRGTTFDEPVLRQLQHRSQQYTWIVAGLVVIAFSCISGLLRRTDIALYRALGASRSEVLLMGVFESAFLVALGFSAGWAWVAAAATQWDSIGLEHVAIGLRSSAAAVALGPITTVAAMLVALSFATADVLKDR